MDKKGEFVRRVSAIRVYRNRRERAPSKPLYLLLLLADLQKGLPRLRPFDLVEPHLAGALRQFGLSTKSGNVSPHYPFWRLKNDGLAEVTPNGPYAIRKSNDDPTVRSLRAAKASGGFLPDDFTLLKSDLSFQTVIIHQILEEHFPRSIHEDLIRFFDLRIAGMRSEDVSTEGEFRNRVIEAYGFRCALSGFQVQYRDSYPGLEAAHICWPQAGGNDQISNGIAMNTLARKLFHLGLFGIDDDYKIIVSASAKETGGSAFFFSINQLKIQVPVSPECRPSIESLSWHRKWVFRG